MLRTKPIPASVPGILQQVTDLRRRATALDSNPISVRLGVEDDDIVMPFGEAPEPVPIKRIKVKDHTMVLVLAVTSATGELVDLHAELHDGRRGGASRYLPTVDQSHSLGLRLYQSGSQPSWPA